MTREVLTTANVASCTSCWPPTAVAKSCARREPCGKLPHHPRTSAENGLHRLCAPSKHVVVEARSWKLERGTGMLEGSHIPCPEARRPREPTVDDRLQPGTRRGLAKRFFEERDCVVDALELSEKDESLGPQRTDFRLGEQVCRDRPGARPLASSVMRTSRIQRPPMALVARVRWRQPERVLGELGRDGRRAAIGRHSRGVVEHNGRTSASGVSLDSARWRARRSGSSTIPAIRP